MQETGLMSVAPGGSIFRDPQDVRKMVLKLRWIGMEKEAQELSDYLAAISPQTVLIDVAPTD